MTNRYIMRLCNQFLFSDEVENRVSITMRNSSNYHEILRPKYLFLKRLIDSYIRKIKP